MKKRYSRNWNSSRQPRKQRKYRANAPLHVKGKFLSARLVKELRDKHGTKALRVRAGDKVRILRGTFAGREGKIERVDVRNGKVFVTKIETVKKDGATKVPYPLEPSNLMITEMHADKKRVKQ